MYDFSAVQELDSFDDLINDKPVMDILEDLLANGIVQVGFHKLKD